MIESLHFLIDSLLALFLYAVIASVIMSWLVQFGVINRGSPFVNQIGEFLYKLTEPALRPIRNLLPDLGGIDISPVILIILIHTGRIFLRNMLIG